MVTVVTGASGFLGGVLVREPLARGQASELSTYGVGRVWRVSTSSGCRQTFSTRQVFGRYGGG